MHKRRCPLCARMDERHDTTVWAGTQKRCERAFGVLCEQKYKCLSTISISHLYNLCKSKAYSKTSTHFEKTRPKKSNFGERRKPHLRFLSV